MEKTNEIILIDLMAHLIESLNDKPTKAVKDSLDRARYYVSEIGKPNLDSLANYKTVMAQRAAKEKAN